MQAIILCGGKGTRLSALYPDCPKILVPIAGRPFLTWQLEWLGRAGVTDVHLAAGYMAEALAGYLAGVQASVSPPRCGPNGPESGKLRTSNTEHRTPHEPASSSFEVRSSAFDVGCLVFQITVSDFTFRVSLSTEPSPLGTGGGVKFVEPWIRSDPFLVLNGDSLAPGLDFAKLAQTHQDARAAAVPSAPPASVVTLTVTRIDAAGRYGTVEFDDSGLVTAFREKAQRESGWINAGIYLVDCAILAAIPSGRCFSLEMDVYPELVRRGQIRACPIPPPLLDMGTPDGVAALEAYLWKSGPCLRLPPRD